MPERTRILRPNLWIDPTTAQLSAEAFRLYLGLATCADDAGWLLWRPVALSGQLQRYQSPAEREATLDVAAAELLTARLLVLHDCGCAVLPLMERDLRVAGGNHTERVVEFHYSEHVSGLVRTRTASGSVSVLGPESISVPVAATGDLSLMRQPGETEVDHGSRVLHEIRAGLNAADGGRHARAADRGPRVR